MLREDLNTLAIRPSSAKLWKNLTPEQMDARWGRFFGMKVAHLPPGFWWGPIDTQEGSFLLYIVKKRGKPLSFEEAEFDLYDHFKLIKTIEKRRESYRKIASHYRVILEKR